MCRNYIAGSFFLFIYGSERPMMDHELRVVNRLMR